MGYQKFVNKMLKSIKGFVLYILLLFANLFPFSDILIKKLSKRLHSIIETYKFQIIFIPLLLLVILGALAVAVREGELAAIFLVIKLFLFSFLFSLLIIVGIVRSIRKSKFGN